MDKEFHVWFNPNFKHPMWDRYSDVVRLIQSGKDRIDTQNIIFADLRLITEHGYRLFIHPEVGDVFEITLGECEHLDRDLRPVMNLLKMILNGAFESNEKFAIVSEVL